MFKKIREEKEKKELEKLLEVVDGKIQGVWTIESLNDGTADKAYSEYLKHEQNPNVLPRFLAKRFICTQEQYYSEDFPLRIGKTSPWNKEFRITEIAIKPFFLPELFCVELKLNSVITDFREHRIEIESLKKHLRQIEKERKELLNKKDKEDWDMYKMNVMDADRRETSGLIKIYEDYWNNFFKDNFNKV